MFTNNFKFRRLENESQLMLKKSFEIENPRDKEFEYQQQNLIVSYVFASIKKNPSSFKIGIYTVFLVISILTLFANITYVSPVLLLNFASTQTGSADIVLNTKGFEVNTEKPKKGQVPPFPYNLKLIRNEDVIPRLLQIKEIKGAIPRWYLLGSAQGQKVKSYKAQAVIILTDILKENNFGYVSKKHLQQLNDNEAYFTESFIKLLDIPLKPGGKVKINFDLIKSMYLGGLLTTSSDNKGYNDDEKFLIESTQLNFEDILMRKIKNFIKDSIKVDFVTSNDIQYIILTEDYSKIFKEEIALKLKEDQYLKKLFKAFYRVYGLGEYEEDLEGFANQNTGIFSLMLQEIGKIIFNYKWKMDISKFIDIVLPQAFDSLQANITFKIKDTLKESGGMWPQSIGNLAIVNTNNFFPLLGVQISKSFYNFFNKMSVDLIEVVEIEDFKEQTDYKAFTDFMYIQMMKQIQNIDPMNYSTSVNIYINDKIQFYRKVDQIEVNLVEISDTIMRSIGIDYPVNIQAPLGKAFKQTALFQVFLDNLFSMVVVLLSILSCLVIHALMLSNVDEKTYEFGMLRSLGLIKRNLLKIILVEALSFSIPGIIVGIVISVILNIFVIFLISTILSTELDYSYSTYALVLGIVIGTFGPVFSILEPVQRALSKTLRDALDLFRKNISTIGITIIKLEQLGISSTLTVISVLYLFIGFITYYLIPFFYIYQRTKEFLIIFNFILLFLLIGVTLLINGIQGKLCRIILHVMLFIYRRDSEIKQICLKSLKSHQARNNRVGLIFSLTIACLLLGGSTFYNQRKQLEYTVQLGFGSDFVIYENSKRGLKTNEIKKFLNYFKEKYPETIDQYTFSTNEINDIPHVRTSFYLSGLSGFAERRVSFVGVEQHYLSSIYYNLYIPVDTKSTWCNNILPNGVEDGVSTLYSNQTYSKEFNKISINNNLDPISLSPLPDTVVKSYIFQQSESTKKLIRVIVPSGASKAMSIRAGQHVQIRTDIGLHYNAYVTQMAQKFPGYIYSDYQYILSLQTLMVSLQDFEFLLNSVWEGSQDVKAQIKTYKKYLYQQNNYGMPFAKLFIKFKKNLNEETRTVLINGLKYILDSQTSLIFDTNKVLEGTEQTFLILRIFYGVLIIVSMTLAFFLLLVSLTKNIKEGQFEIGVLRAIGLTKTKVTKIYFYEAVTNINAAGIVGLVSGGLVSFILVKQIAMLTELNLNFQIPWIDFGYLLILGNLLAAIAPPFSIKLINNKSISSILKSA